MSKQDGGPAFPLGWRPTADGYERGDCGMSLRDWFAGQALAGFGGANGITRDSSGFIAEAAYTIADAMLAERSKP